MRGCAAARRGCIVNTASMLSFFGGGLVRAGLDRHPADESATGRPGAHAAGPLGHAGGHPPLVWFRPLLLNTVTGSWVGPGAGYIDQFVR
jgi:hypothetical protein